MKEEAVLFGKSENLVGIITNPNGSVHSNHLPAVIILNSGVIHHVGPNRLSVKIARKLSSIGFLCIRIDFSGIGDSPHAAEQSAVGVRWVQETREAMNKIYTEKGINQFIVLGNCSGAGVAYQAAKSDRRVHGVALINLQGHRKLLRYYLKLAFTNRKLWIRLFTGTINKKSLRQTLDLYMKKKTVSARGEGFDVKDFISDLKANLENGLKILFAYSEWDPGLPYFKKYLKKPLLQISDQENYDFDIIRGSNHDFSLLEGQAALIQIVTRWLAANYGLQV